MYPAASRCLSVRKWHLVNSRKDIHEILYRTVVVAFIQNIKFGSKLDENNVHIHDHFHCMSPNDYCTKDIVNKICIQM